MSGRWALAAAAGALAGLGCSRVGSTVGELFGAEPGPWVSGFWYTTDEGYPDRTFVKATMVDFRNACNDHISLLADYLGAYEAYRSGSTNLEGLATALEAADADWLPEKRWEFYFEIMTQDLSAVSGGTFDSGPDFALHIWQVWRQESWHEKLGLGGSAAEDPTCFGSVEGEARVLSYADGADLQAEGEAAMVDCYQGADAGAVGFEFAVPPCDGYAALHDAWQDALRDLGS